MKRFKIERVDMQQVLNPGPGQTLNPRVAGLKWRSTCPACPGPGETYHPSWEWAWASVKDHLKRHASRWAELALASEAAGSERVYAATSFNQLGQVDGLAMLADEDESQQFRHIPVIL